MDRNLKKTCKLLKQLPVTERFVFRTLARYIETADVKDRLQEGPLLCRMVKYERIRRNPLRHQERLPAGIDLRLGPYRRSSTERNAVHSMCCTPQMFSSKMLRSEGENAATTH